MVCAQQERAAARRREEQCSSHRRKSIFTSHRRARFFSGRMAPIFAFWGTCKRGAATAVYDYANFGERLLGIERPLIVCSNSLNGDDASLKLNLKRLRARFGAGRVFMMKQR